MSSFKDSGAVVQIAKALAARRGLEVRSHAELYREVARLDRDVGGHEIRMLRQSAVVLHQNFYENWLPAGIVEWNISDVKKLVGKIKKLVSSTH